MARIRSVKPEYWLDRKLARGVSRDARLLYIGLWNHADEHGRLHGDPAVIKGQVFPYDDDVSIPQLLAELVALGRVQAYEHDGDPYLYLPKLSKHQRLEPSKAKSRLPDPPDMPDPPFRPDPPSSRPLSEKTAAESEPIAAGSEPIVVQQVAGSRLQVAGGKEHVAGSMVARQKRGADQTAQALVGEWIDHCDGRPPNRVIGQIAREIGLMLEEGQPYDKVRNGLALWQTKRLHPSALASCVFEASQPAPNKAAQRTNEHLAIVRDLEALEQGDTA